MVFEIFVEFSILIIKINRPRTVGGLINLPVIPIVMLIVENALSHLVFADLPPYFYCVGFVFVF